MNSAGPSGPVRTCIGCRTRRPDHELIRIAVDPDGGADPVIGRRSAPGRGAWLCPNEPCVEAAARTRAFSRAFRTKIADAYFADRVSRWLAQTR